MTPYEYSAEGPLQGALQNIDRLLWRLGGLFIVICNLCLLAMLTLTSVTIIMRPLGWSAYWIWPWTMVFFVWLSFFGMFAMYVRLKDIRVDFFADRMGPLGYPLTRAVSDVAALSVAGLLVWLAPEVLRTSRGFVDGAILPGGAELPRQALSVPLFFSSALIFLTALSDLAKLATGLPENVSDHHPET